MKATKAQVARHLAVKEDDVMEIGEREGTGEVVAILTDYRKFVFPPSALKEAPQPAGPAPGEALPLPEGGKVVVRK